MTSLAKQTGKEDAGAIRALLRRIVRVGNVSARYPEEGAVQVDFRDAGPDGTASWRCPVLQPKTKADKAFWMPDKGERVLVISLPQGEEFGLVVGAYYNDRDAVPDEAEGSNDRAVVRFDDGTYVVYDRADSSLTVDAAGNVTVNAEGPVTVDTEGEFTVEAAGDATVLTEGKATVEAQQKALIKGASGVDLDGGPGAVMNVLVHPKAISPFTGNPITPPSNTVKASP